MSLRTAAKLTARLAEGRPCAFVWFPEALRRQDVDRGRRHELDPPLARSEPSLAVEAEGGKAAFRR